MTNLIYVYDFLALRFLRQRLDVTVDIEEMETEASQTQVGEMCCLVQQQIYYAVIRYLYLLCLHIRKFVVQVQ